MCCYPWNDIMDRNCFLLGALDTMGTPISSWLDQLYSSPVTSDNQTAKKHQGISTILYFQRKIVLIFVTIWIQICLHYNCFQEVFSEKYFPKFKWRFAWMFRMTIYKWSWKSRIYITDNIGGFSLPSLLMAAQVLHPGCHCLHHCLFALYFKFTSKLKWIILFSIQYIQYSLVYILILKHKK